jgi:hypothetical protein
MYWYCYHVTVQSATEITFHVHGMRDSVYGSIGERIAELHTNVAPSTIGELLQTRANMLARDRYIAEKVARVNKIIKSYADAYLYEAMKESPP